MNIRWVTIALLLAGVIASAETHAQKKKRGRAERVVEPPVVFDPAIINNPSQPEISQDTKGSAVLRAQILLGRAHYSCGEIDGHFGSNMQKVVTAYQANHNLPSSGTVDAATWAALNADTSPALTAYTITTEDEQGPFVRVPTDMMEKAELKALGYSSPLELLAERFHVKPAVLQALNPGANFNKVGQQLTAPNVLVMPPGEAAAVVVSKSSNAVIAYDASGKVLAFYMATIGSTHDPLPLGEWKISSIQRNPAFHYNAKLFWDAKNPDERALIKPGPNNPVGLVWMDLSKEHYGIHGTPEPGTIGHTNSHGCIRLTNWDVVELASMVKPGTPAILKE